MTLTFNPVRAVIMTYSRAKGQWLVGSKDVVETNGQINRGDCITSLANVVDNDLE